MANQITGRIIEIGQTVQIPPPVDANGNAKDDQLPF